MKKRPRIHVFASELMHDKRVIDILHKIYNLSINEVKRIYYKMDKKIKETKMMICLTYPDLYY